MGKAHTDSEGSAKKALEQATKEWRALAQPIYDEWVADMKGKGIDGQALIDEARMLIDKYTE